MTSGVCDHLDSCSDPSRGLVWNICPHASLLQDCLSLPSHRGTSFRLCRNLPHHRIIPLHLFHTGTQRNSRPPSQIHRTSGCNYRADGRTHGHSVAAEQHLEYQEHSEHTKQQPESGVCNVQTVRLVSFHFTCGVHVSVSNFSVRVVRYGLGRGDVVRADDDVHASVWIEQV